MRGLAAVLSAMTAAMGVRLASDNFLTDDTWPSIVQHRRCQGITNGTNLTDTNSTPYHCQLVAISRGHRYFAFKGQDNKEKCETYPSCDATYPSNKEHKQWAIYEYHISVNGELHVPGTWYITLMGAGIGGKNADTHVVTGYEDDTWTMDGLGYEDDTGKVDCPVLRGSVSGESTSISTFCKAHEEVRESELKLALARFQTPDLSKDLDFGHYRYFKADAPGNGTTSVGDGIHSGKVFYEDQGDVYNPMFKVCGNATDTVEFQYWSGSIWTPFDGNAAFSPSYPGNAVLTNGVWSSTHPPFGHWKRGNSMRAMINGFMARFSLTTVLVKDEETAARLPTISNATNKYNYLPTEGVSC